MRVSETEDENTEAPEKKSLFKRMKEGLTRSTRAMSDGVTGIFTRRKLDGETLQDLEDLLRRCSQKTIHHAGGRRERRRQDNNHRQDRVKDKS